MTDVGRGPSQTLAIPDASPRAAVRYLATIKPALASAVAARSVWLRELRALRERPDLAAGQAEAVQVALGQAQQFNEARRSMSVVPVPQNCVDMHRQLDAWLRGMAASCEAIVKAKAPMTSDAVDEARELMREAAKAADKFNEERALVVASLQDASTAANRPKFIANSRELRAAAIALLGSLLAVGLIVYALNALTASTVGPNGTVTGTEKRIFTQPQILDRLKQEIELRKVAFHNPGIELVEPDTVIVSGQIPASQLPLASIVWEPDKIVDVRAEVKISAENGKVKLTANKLSSGNVSITVPQWANDALNKRTDEANNETNKQLKPTEWLAALYVKKDIPGCNPPQGATGNALNCVVAEIQTIDPNKPPPASGTPTAKP